MRNITAFDNVINAFDAALRTLAPPSSRPSQRPSPAMAIQENSLDDKQKKHVAGLMRVNHAGEVCAQALYQGQALTAQLVQVKKQMEAAAEEEVDHLAWCEQRLQELGSHTSVFNPFWYIGSFVIGTVAGFAGDHISLGFVAETEEQVSAHLQNHLQKLPMQDKKTKAILEQMHEDEAHHAQVAREAGAIELSLLTKTIMEKVSKIMTNASYYL